MKRTRSPLPRLLTALSLLAALAWGQPGAHATAFTWNNGAANATWDITSLNWTGSAWVNNTNNTAAFGSTGVGTITLGVPITNNAITFGTAGYTLTGGTLNFAGIAPTITATANATINSALTGTLGLTKAGAGTLTLGGANTYSGTTTVSAGTLALGNVTYSAGSPVSVASGAALNSGGTLYLNVNSTSTALDATGAGTVNLTSTTNSATYPDLYFGSNHSGTADYGTRLTAALNLGSLQRYVYGKSGRNDITRYLLTGCDCQFAGPISGSGGLTFIGQNSFGPGVNIMEVPFALNATNTFSGTLEIQRGSVYLGNAGALTAGNVLLMDPPAGTTNNARLFLFGNSINVADLQSSGPGTNIVIADGNGATSTNISPAVLTVTQNNPYTFSGSLRDYFTEYATPPTGSFTAMLSFVKQGTNTLTLAGTNTYTGSTTVSNGTLQIAGTLGSGTYSRLITNNATLAWSSAIPQTLSGTITGSGALVQSGTAALTLSGTNTYTGGTTLNSGSVAVVTNGNLGTGPLTASLTSSSTLTVANTNAVTLTNAIVLGTPGSATTFNLVKNTAGTTSGTQLTLSGPISGGNANITLFLNSSTAGDKTTSYLFAGTNSFQVGEFNLNRGCLLVGNAAALGNSANLLYLDGNNNTTAGDLQFLAPMTVPNPIEFPAGGSTAVGIGTNNVTFTGPVSGLTVTKLGTGILTLAGTNTYTGNTTISAGTLALTGTASIAGTPNILLPAGTTFDVSGLTSPFVLGGGQTLKGSGTGTSAVIGAFADSGGSVLIPGGLTNVGTLSFTGDLTLAGGDTLDFDLGKNPASAGGTNSDRITVTGNLTINPGTTVSINPIQVSLAGGTYKLITYGGTLTDNTGGIATSWTVGYTPSGRVISATLSTATPGEIDLIVTGSPANLTWLGDGVANAWDIQTTTNWLNAGTPDLYYEADNVLFNDLGSNTPPVNLVAAVNPSSVTVSNTQPYVFESTFGQGINGGTGLAKNGSGTLTILNNNPYAGVTAINGGTLQLGDGATSDGTLPNSPIADNATLEFNVYSSQTAAHTISGTGTVIATGTSYGTLTLAASNSWTGGLNIQSGTVMETANAAVPPNSSVTIAAGGAFDFNGVINSGSTGYGYSFTIAGSGPYGNGAIVNSSATGINAYSSVSNLTLSADAAIGGNSGRWDVGQPAGSTVNGNGHHLVKAGSNLMGLQSQIITNLADLTVTNGQLFYQSYNQTNPWTAGITNYVAGGASLGAYTSLTLNFPVVLDGGTLYNQGSGTPNWTGPVQLTANNGTFSTATSPTLVSGSVSGPGVLNIVNGTSSVTLSGSNSYAGGTTINQGTLIVANTNALGTGNVSINTGALYFNFPGGSTSVITNSISLPGTATQEFTIQGPTNFTTVRLTGEISGGGGGNYNLMDSGVGGNHYPILILDNTNNSFAAGILMNRGSLGFTSDAALGSAGNPILLDTWNLNGALTFEADGITLNSGRNITLVYSTSTVYPAPINVQGYTGTIAGVMSGIGNFVKQGSGTLILTAANTFTGPTTVSAGTLLVNGSTATGAVTVQTNTTLGGSGTVGGAVTVQTGGNLRGGDGGYANTLTLAGTTTLGTTTNSVTASTFTIATGGTIAAAALKVNGTNYVNILDGPLPAGTNTLITYTGGSIGGTNGFAGFQLGSVSVGAGLVAQLLNTGSALQLAVLPGIIVATNPPVLTNTLTGSSLSLAWPADHIGWRLLAQTNNLAAGISANTNDWGTVTGSAATNQVTLPINPALPAEFYRLVYP